MKTDEVIAYLDSRFHPEYQEDYDNSGFLVGNRDSEYTGALVALDLTDEVLCEAQEHGLNLIVTHHPLIFGGLKRLRSDVPGEALIIRLIQSGVNVYAAHTNLDNLPWGVSGELAARLGLEGCRVLRPAAMDADGHKVGAGIVGELSEPQTADRLLQQVKALLGLPVVRLSQPASTLATRRVRRVALCGGSGAEFIADAKAAGADIYLTADLKYHDFQRTGGRMLLADIGHYESEQFAKEIILRCISEKFSTFACRISERQGGIVSYI